MRGPTDTDWFYCYDPCVAPLTRPAGAKEVDDHDEAQARSPMIARDLVGYGEFPPHPAWPGGALIAVNFNLNIEGGGEASLANGDDVSEGMLNDIGVPTQLRRRVPLVESVFEFGSRRGAWRVLDILRDFSVAVSVLGVARALEQNPELARACVERGHEIVSHGYRWIDYGDVPEDVERDHIRRAIDILEKSPARGRSAG